MWFKEEAYVVEGPNIRAIGWLDDKHEFPKGNAPGKFIDKLSMFVSRGDESSLALGFEKFFGSHTCELCGDRDCSNEIGVPANGLLYVAPEMILHYVEDHDYRPPEEFIEAVLSSPLPGSREYKNLVAPFVQQSFASIVNDPVNKKRFEELSSAAGVQLSPTHFWAKLKDKRSKPKK